jgi:hypothetical protein
VEAAERRRTVERIGQKLKWPSWPVLPMKRRYINDRGVWQVDAAGYSLLADCDTVIVRGWPRDPRSYWTALQAAEGSGDHPLVVARYATVEALLDDGWTVDES